MQVLIKLHLFLLPFLNLRDFSFDYILDHLCNPDGSLLKGANLTPSIDGQTVLAAIILFGTAVYSWWVFFPVY